MQQPKSDSSSLVLSYLTLRKAIGLLGVSLPFILSLGAMLVFNEGIQESISHYYYTGMGDVFVGTLFALGLFLFSYKGYEKKDDVAGDLACLFAVGVALFPTTPLCDPNALLLCDPQLPSYAPTPNEQIIGKIHLAFAAAFFLMLAYFSLFLFTKTDSKKPMTPTKRRRNQVYRTCGITIVVSIILIVLLAVLPSDIENAVRELNPVFWLESVAVVAFGLSWLTKGEAILREQT